MAAEARRLGVGLRVLESGGYDEPARQAEQIRACTTDPRTDALLVGTVSYDAFDDALRAFGRMHPVLGLVNDIDPRAVQGKVGVPWQELGRRIGRWLAARHPAGTPAVDVAWFPGPRDAGWVPIIDRGFRQAIEASAVRVAVVKWGDTGRTVQRRLVEEALDEHPSVRYLVGNGPMAEVAVSELRRRQAQSRVAIVASYVTPGVHSAIGRGRILMAVTDFPVLQGRLAVRRRARRCAASRSTPASGRRSS